MLWFRLFWVWAVTVKNETNSGKSPLGLFWSPRPSTLWGILSWHQPVLPLRLRAFQPQINQLFSTTCIPMRPLSTGACLSLWNSWVQLNFSPPLLAEQLDEPHQDPSSSPDPIVKVSTTVLLFVCFHSHSHCRPPVCNVTSFQNAKSVKNVESTDKVENTRTPRASRMLRVPRALISQKATSLQDRGSSSYLLFFHQQCADHLPSTVTQAWEMINVALDIFRSYSDPVLIQPPCNYPQFCLGFSYWWFSGSVVLWALGPHNSRLLGPASDNLFFWTQTPQ